MNYTEIRYVTDVRRIRSLSAAIFICITINDFQYMPDDIYSRQLAVDDEMGCKFKCGLQRIEDIRAEMGDYRFYIYGLHRNINPTRLYYISDGPCDICLYFIQKYNECAPTYEIGKGLKLIL